jgi:hypothetical protein
MVKSIPDFSLREEFELDKRIDRLFKIRVFSFCHPHASGNPVTYLSGFMRYPVNEQYRIMSKVTSVKKAQNAKTKKVVSSRSTESFAPCSQDMTICGDCEGNRAKKKCPRLKEWLAKREG